MQLRFATAAFAALACSRPAPTVVPPSDAPGSTSQARPAPEAADAPASEPSRSADDSIDAPQPSQPADRSRPADSGAPAPTASAYDRSQWPHWIDVDGDCQDTRTEVLVAESIGPVTFTDARQCEVASGRWRCPYTDRTFSDPRQLDVDHFVPLAEAHRSGGDRWSKAKRTAYANDLGDPEHLVAVFKSANRSKGSKNITSWLPEEPGSRCAYVETWLRIKKHWGLRIDENEHAAADGYLQVCAAKDVPELVKTPKRESKARSATRPPTAAASGACCRMCESGKPCGDGCIAAEKTCRKPVGCACAAP